MKLSFYSAVSTTIGLVLISTFSYAERNPFRALKLDVNVPEKCQEYKPSFFTAEAITYFTVGSRGSTNSGFSAEVPIERGEAKILWDALKPSSSDRTIENAMKKINNNETLTKFFKILNEGKSEREATYNSEGEILEVLTYAYLPGTSMFEEMLERHAEETGEFTTDVFLTGGVSYHASNGQTLGELDVILADAKTCTIFGIGEAKLGRKRSKALKQLERIRGFIRKL